MAILYPGSVQEAFGLSLNIKGIVCVILNVFYLGEKGEMSCLSLAQLMVGGGTLWTSHGKTASSPSITDILIGSAAPPAPLTLDLGRTGRTYMGRQTQRFNSSQVYMTISDNVLISLKVQTRS